MQEKLQVESIKILTGHTGSIYALEAIDESHFISSGGDGQIIMWDMDDLDNGKLVARIPEQVFSLKYDKAHQRIFIGNMNGGLHLIDWNNKKNLSNVSIHDKGIYKIEIQDNKLYTLGGGGYLKIWDLNSLKLIESIQLSGKPLRDITFTPEGEAYITASDGNIYILNSTNQLKETIKGENNSIFSIVFNGSELITGDRNAAIKVWNSNDNTLSQTIPAHLYTVNKLCLMPNLSIFASASRDKTIKIWDSVNYQLKKVIDGPKGGHFGSVNALLWDKNAKNLYSASDDRTIKVWKINTEA